MALAQGGTTDDQPGGRGWLRAYAPDAETVALFNFDRAVESGSGRRGFRNLAGDGGLDCPGGARGLDKGLPGLGKAAYFPGNRIATLEAMALAASAPYTVEFWCKPEAHDGTIVSLGRAPDRSLGFLLHRKRRNIVVSNSLGTPDVVSLESRPVELGKWRHVALTCEPGKSMALFVNGQKETEVDLPAPPPGPADEGVMSMVAGASIRKVGVYQGWLDELRISQATRSFRPDPEGLARLRPRVRAPQNPWGAFLRLAAASDLAAQFRKQGAEFPSDPALIQVTIVNLLGDAQAEVAVRCNPERLLCGDFFVPTGRVPWRATHLLEARAGRLRLLSGGEGLAISRNGNRGADTMDLMEWRVRDWGEAGEELAYFVLFRDAEGTARFIGPDDAVALRPERTGLLWQDSDLAVDLAFTPAAAPAAATRSDDDGLAVETVLGAGRMATFPCGADPAHVGWRTPQPRVPVGRALRSALCLGAAFEAPGLPPFRAHLPVPRPQLVEWASMFERERPGNGPSGARGPRQFSIAKGEPLVLAWRVRSHEEAGVRARLVLQSGGDQRVLQGRHFLVRSIKGMRTVPYAGSVRKLTRLPARYPEVLAPWSAPLPVEAGETVLVWTRFDDAGAGQPGAGSYDGRLEVTVGQAVHGLDLRLVVRDFPFPRDHVIPHIVGMGSAYWPDDCDGQYDTGIFPVDRRELAEVLERFARRHDFETYYYNSWRSPYFLEWRYDAQTAQATLDWAPFESAVLRLRQAGKRWFNLNNEFSVGGGAVHRIFDTMGGREEQLSYRTHAEYRKRLLEFAKTNYRYFDAEEGRKRFEAFFAAVAEHARRSGILENLYFYTTDEPEPRRYGLIEEVCAAARRHGIEAMTLDNRVHENFRAARWQTFYFLVLIHDKPFAAVDLKGAEVPDARETGFREVVRRLQAEGRTVYWYATGQFNGDSERRPCVESVFMPLLDCYVVPIMTWAYGIDGLLQPHYLLYKKDPWKHDASYGWAWLFPPHREMVARGAAADPPVWTTLRFEMIQKGRRDAAYFAKLQESASALPAGDPLRPKILAFLGEVRETVMQGWLYPDDPAVYVAWRDRAGRWLEDLHRRGRLQP